MGDLLPFRVSFVPSICLQLLFTRLFCLKTSLNFVLQASLQRREPRLQYQEARALLSAEAQAAT